MLLRFFRINDPYRLVVIALVLVLITLPLFVNPAELTLDELKMMVLGEVLNDGKSLYAQVIANTPPLAAWVSGWADWLMGRSILARHIIGLLLIFFQLSFFTYILIKNKAHHENTYLPGLIFGLLALISFDMISMTYELLASTVLLFAINNLFKEIEFRIQRDEIVLNLGVYLGVASLLVFSYAVFLPGTLIILAIFTRLTLRKALVLIFGFAIPHCVLFVLYFWKGNTSSLIENYYLGNLASGNTISMTGAAILFLSAIPLLFLLFSMVMLNREARLTKYQSQLSQVMFLWIVLSLIELIVSPGLKPQHLLIFIPPFSYFISHFILLIRRKKLAEFTIWIFIISISSVLYLARYNRIQTVNYTALFPVTSKHNYTGKRVLILGNDWSLFKNNKMAGGFFDWRLSGTIFTDLQYFDNVVMLDKMLEEDAPEIIIDDNQLMEKVFTALPSKRQHYTKESGVYIKKP